MVRISLSIIVALVVGVAAASVSPGSTPIHESPPMRALTPLEEGIVREHNLARQDPKGYAAHVQALRELFDGQFIRIPGQATVLTREGVEAVDEAIAFLMTIEPAPALSTSQGMSDAAADHVLDQGPAGKTGHGGSDGSRPAERVARHGSWDIIVAENLSYGPDMARHVVMGLIIDDGVPDRGHRTTIFNGALNVIGVSCGPHVTFGTMCTMDYAGEFTEQASSDDVTPQGARSEK